MEIILEARSNSKRTKIVRQCEGKNSCSFSNMRKPPELMNKNPLDQIVALLKKRKILFRYILCYIINLYMEILTGKETYTQYIIFGKHISGVCSCYYL